MERVTLVGRRWIYGTIEVMCATKEEATSNATKILRSDKVNLLLMYKAR